MELSPILSYALEACRAVSTNSDVFCYTWLDDKYKDGRVRPHHLRQLLKLGFLTRVDGSRSGHRAYYRLALKPLAPQTVQ